MSILEKLTEGIVNRDMKKEGAALLSKWEKTGLLEGISNERHRHSMARLLENQAKELLREASSLSAGGDVEGFAAVAFPIVRRVFGGLIANDLVSVQPMSLPSGLIFFLDFTFSSPPGSKGAAGAELNKSIYGGQRVGQEITGGVLLDDNEGNGTSRQDSGFYNLSNGYASPTGSSQVVVTVVASGTAGTDYSDKLERHNFTSGYENLGRLTRYDTDLSGTEVAIGRISATDAGWSNLNEDNLVTLYHSGSTHGQLIRRLTVKDPINDGYYLVVNAATGSEFSNQLAVDWDDIAITFTHAIKDPFSTTRQAAGTNALGSVMADTGWGLEKQTEIPEIDIKVDSVSVTAMTKKLKAKWTPELGQDLNAYHNLDAEVELTSILSEQIALEIDREILEDLLKGAKGATYYWSRSPGLFVNRTTGVEIGQSSAAPDFTGTVSEWYETLCETINDVSAAIHRKTLRGGANFLVTSPEVANILEFTSGFRANVTHDDDKGTVGAVNVGSLSKKWDVYVDPYFPRNLVLVGRKGNSFLESGYVYSPYVPLQVTPTIFGTEDFVPRKGVMTRYAKKMVRPDMYGVVIVRGLLGEAGATS
jgi:hypothetical protein